MEKRCYLSTGKPLLTCMVQGTAPERVKELITLSRPEGAEAFGMQLCKLESRYHSREVYRELISFAAPQPTTISAATSNTMDACCLSAAQP